MLKLIKKITGGDLNKLYGGIVFCVLENAVTAASVASFCLFFLALAAGGGTTEALWLGFWGVCACFVLRAVFSIKSYTRAMTAAYEITAGVRLKLGEHLRKLPMGFFMRKDLGSLSNFVLQDTALLDFLFSHITLKWLTGILLPLFIAAVLAFMHGPLFGIAVLPLLLSLPIFIRAVSIIKNQGFERLDIIDKTDSAMLEYIQGIRVMKSYGMLGAQNKKLIELIRTLSRKSVHIEALVVGHGMVFSALVEAGFALMLLAAAFLYNQGSIAGAMVVAVMYVACRFYAPLFDLMQYSLLARYMVNAGRRIEEIIDTPAIKQADTPKLPDGCGIKFADVSFAYSGQDVLKHINLQIKEKTMTALVGPSGSGKTTIANLMARFWDDYRGSISIGGVEIRDIDPEKLMSLFAFVFQDVYLFSDTIINNILAGNPGATRQEALQAAKKANCHEFISKLPAGYETMVGEGGSTLSGGEKQRISIARAMLKNAPIVVLDEATTSLDPVNESLVLDAINALVKEKTLVVIAHRLHTVIQADQVIVLNNGEITESGTHAELFARQGRYRAMWASFLEQDEKDPNSVL